MKSFILAAALLTSTAAFAQQQPAGPESAPPSDPSATAPAPDASSSGAGAATSSSMSTGSSASGTQMASNDYPMCSRTVTDKCMERSGASRSHRSTRHR